MSKQRAHPFHDPSHVLVGAGVLAPVVRGGAAGVRALLKRATGIEVRGSLAKAAERFLRRQVEIEDSSPFNATPTARAEHAARMREAQVSLREGRPARIAVIRAVASIGLDHFGESLHSVSPPGDGPLGMPVAA